MVKVPSIGRVKTRLAAETSAARAVGFYRHAAAAVIARLSSSRAWQTVLAVSPDTGIRHAMWPRRLARLGQGRGDLGLRMQRAIDRQPPGPVAVIGTDIPAIRPQHIAAAFKALGNADAVLGPTPDGGYWLVGLRRTPRRVAPFTAVRWSSRHALADTRRNLTGCRFAEIASLRDVDTRADLDRAAAWAGRRVLPASIRCDSLNSTCE